MSTNVSRLLSLLVQSILVLEKQMESTNHVCMLKETIVTISRSQNKKSYPNDKPKNCMLKKLVMDKNALVFVG